MVASLNLCSQRLFLRADAVDLAAGSMSDPDSSKRVDERGAMLPPSRARLSLPEAMKPEGKGVTTDRACHSDKSWVCCG
eukprot:968771-Rhodomonas_salina.2